MRVRAIGLKLAGENPTVELTIYSDEPGVPDAILPEPVGLDGRWRSKLTAYAFVANKGRWLDSRTFMLERRILGEGAMESGTLHFEGDRLDLRYRNTDGFAVELRGEAAN